MKAHETVATVRLQKQKQQSGQEGHIRQSGGEIVGQSSSFSRRMRHGLHRVSATRTECGSLRHLRRTPWTGLLRNLGFFHRREPYQKQTPATNPRTKLTD